MNKLKHLPKSIPDKDQEFELKVTGTLTKEKYLGTFKCRIPNLRTQAQIAKTKAFLNAGYDESLDAQAKNLHHMVSYLKHTITEAPEWFSESESGYDLYDVNVVEEIYRKVLGYEEAWLKKIWGNSKENTNELE